MSNTDDKTLQEQRRKETLKRCQKDWYERNKDRLRQEYYEHKGKPLKHSVKFYKEFYDKYHEVVQHIKV